MVRAKNKKAKHTAWTRRDNDHRRGRESNALSSATNVGVLLLILLESRESL